MYLWHVEPKLVGVVGHLLVGAEDGSGDIEGRLVIRVWRIGRVAVRSSPLVAVRAFRQNWERIS